MLECYNWLFCNLIGDNRFSVILHKSMMLSRPDPLPFYERVWLRQTMVVCGGRRYRRATHKTEVDEREKESVERGMHTLSSTGKDCGHLV